MKRSNFHSSRHKSSGRHNIGAASAGLRSIQSVHSLVVPSLGKGPTVLQHVPEHGEMDLQTSVVPKPREIFRSADWNSLLEAIKELFDGEDPLATPGELYKLHQNVKNILKSKTGTFLTDYYKQELLAKGMNILVEKLKNVKGARLLQRMEEIWFSFFIKMLPILEAIFYLVKSKARLTIRTTTLVAFRDQVVLCVDLKDTIKEAKVGRKPISDGIKHMLMILQNVNECYPPSKNKLMLESIVALVISPYLGYLGLYEGSSTPTVNSNEPRLANRRRSSVDVGGPRRISRPFSVQPLQMDTLNQMFLNAIRNKQDNHRE